MRFVRIDRRDHCPDTDDARCRARELCIIVLSSGEWYLIREGLKPDAEGAAKHNIEMKVIDNLHGKFIVIGEDIAVISIGYLPRSKAPAREALS